MAKVSRIIPRAMMHVGLGVSNKIVPSMCGLISYPVCPAPVTRSITPSAPVNYGKKRKAKPK